MKRFEVLVGDSDGWVRHTLCDGCLDREYVSALRKAGRLVSEPRETKDSCMACGDAS